MNTLLTDSLIIFNPLLSDVPKFEPTAGMAIYIVEHSEKGAIGIAMNKNYSRSLMAISETLPALALLASEDLATDKVMAGGPLAQDRPWLLSRNRKQYQSTLSNDSLSLNFGLQAFRDNGRSHLSVCGIGTFGWGPGQLECELASSLWHHYPTTRDILETIPFAKEVAGTPDLLYFLKHTNLKPPGKLSRFLGWQGSSR